MTAEKIDKLEARLIEQGKILRKIEGALEYLAKNFDSIISIKDDVITQKEKLKVTEARLSQIEGDCRSLQNAINGVHIKIAMFSGIWSAIIYYFANLPK